MKVISKTIARQVLKTKKNSPHIFFVAGIAGTVTSTVMACRATLKLSETLDDINSEINMAKGDNVNPQTMAYIYGKSSARLIKLYGPAVGVGIVSLGALTGSHVQLTRRNAALTVAYAGVSKAFEEYRARVQEELGTDKELEVYRGTDTEEVVDEKGKTQTIKTTVDPSKVSPYARFFDESSPNWEKDAEINRMFVECQQRYANHLLNARGHVFLNEIYDALGFERSSAGAIVGWVLDGDGDNHIDFGIYTPRNAEFVNGTERSILLDFNVDGVVYDKI